MRDNARAVAALERAILRGPRPRAGSAGLASALDAFGAQLAKYRAKEDSDLHGSDPRTRLFDADLEAAAELVAGSPRRSRRSKTSATASARSAILPRVTATCWRLCRAMARTEHAFVGPDGTKLADALDELAISEAAAGMAIEPSDYVELFSALVADRVVRAPPLAGARVRILGLLEARLTANDRVVLGGLVEGVVAAGDAHRRLAQPADAA